MHWIISALKNYAVFEGRARRSEYWYFTLFMILLCLAVGFMEGYLGSSGVFVLVLWAAMVIPSISSAVRRMHDIGKSGWYVLIGYIPFIGLIFLYWAFKDSQPERNQYGPCPK